MTSCFQASSISNCMAALGALTDRESVIYNASVNLKSTPLKDMLHEKDCYCFRETTGKKKHTQAAPS